MESRLEQPRIQSEHGRAAIAALATTNAMAMRQSSKVTATNRRVAALLGDSLRLAGKQIVQVAEKRDALDKPLGDEPLARYALVATIDSFRRTTCCHGHTGTGRHCSAYGRHRAGHYPARGRSAMRSVATSAWGSGAFLGTGMLIRV